MVGGHVETFAGIMAKVVKYRWILFDRFALSNVGGLGQVVSLEVADTGSVELFAVIIEHVGPRAFPSPHQDGRQVATVQDSLFREFGSG